MDLDHRPHFRTTSTGHNSNTTTTTNELFICFTSRLSSSSMKLTKSILSPARAARDGAAAGAASGGPVSLSSSLSRRLRSNGSLKGGGASPFLSTAGKRRGAGAGFENPEPSSPKVTCIGQVRVKTKKKAKQTRSLSKRRSGEMSFRRTEQQSTSDNNSGGGGGGDKDSIAGNHQQIRYSNAGGAHYQQQQPAQECLPHRNQRWVHLPVSICEALRDFSCLFPCKSSCFSKTESKQAGPSDENGCGAVFARWLVSVNDGEGGKRREIELVVGGGDEEEERVSMRSSRRHVFDDIEVKDGGRIEIKGQGLEKGDCEEKGRVSICIPPKNALLLMRCRSDPMKMASLANRFSWDAQGVCGNVCEKNVQVEKQEVVSQEQGSKNEEVVIEKVVVDENNEERRILDEMEQEILELMKYGKVGDLEGNKVDNELLVTGSEEMVEEIEKGEGLEQEIGEKLVENEEEEEGIESNMSSFEDLLDQENTENYEDGPIEEEKDSPSICHLSPSTESDVKINQISPVLEEDEEEEVSSMEKENEESSIFVEKDSTFAKNEENLVKPDPETTQQEEEDEESCELMDKSENQDFFEEPKKEKILPDCLLLMMCEPKLSMEVSKETWVCSTDFIRWMPERPRKAVAVPSKAGGVDQGPVKRRLSIDSKASKPPIRGNYEKPRSSCSLPAAAASMAAVIEQKLVNAVGYEPFALTRCKSEPMRTAAAKLMPDSCLIWKNAVRKMEPHRRAAVGVGAAGVGY